MRKKKIKILHVAQAAGGVDRYIRMLLKYLDKLVSKGVEDVHNRFDAQRVSEEHGILFENMWKVETI